MPDNLQDWMDWTTGVTGADAPDPILTKEEIEDIVDGVVATLGSFFTDPQDLPATAIARPRGIFSDPHDLQSYLDGGGLMSYSDAGNPVPNPVVNILKVTHPSGLITYEVWIDDNTN